MYPNSFDITYQCVHKVLDIYNHLFFLWFIDIFMDVPPTLSPQQIQNKFKCNLKSIYIYINIIIINALSNIIVCESNLRHN